jgi:hypothetical protein
MSIIDRLRNSTRALPRRVKATACSSLRRQFRQRRASIALVGAAVIAMLTGLAAVAVDLGTAYLAKVGDQRAADSAAFAGALGLYCDRVAGRDRRDERGGRQSRDAGRACRGHGDRHAGRLAQWKRQPRAAGDDDHGGAAIYGEGVPEQRDAVGARPPAPRLSREHRLASSRCRPAEPD